MELKGGYQLRVLREALGCTMRDVENASLQIARRLGSEEFGIPPSRLSDIETKGVVPSVFRFYSLAAIYRRDYRELLSWYGVDLNDIHLDVGAAHPPSSHVSKASESIAQISIPVRLDPGFSLKTTTNFGRMIEQWGVVPLSYLSMFAADDRYSYGYIGSEDFTMYPILPPGSFVQVDERRALSVPGAKCSGTTSCCNRILCRLCLSAFCGIRKRLKLSDRWSGWRCVLVTGTCLALH